MRSTAFSEKHALWSAYAISKQAKHPHVCTSLFQADVRPGMSVSPQFIMHRLVCLSVSSDSRPCLSASSHSLSHVVVQEHRWVSCPLQTAKGSQCSRGGPMGARLRAGQGNQYNTIHCTLGTVPLPMAYSPSLSAPLCSKILGQF
jgi:hypothetical protein